MGDMMKMPTRTPQHDKVEFMAGDWKTREVHQPSPWAPNGATGEGRSTTRWGVGKLSLITDYKSKGSTGMEFEGHGVMTWDEKSQAFLSWWFDNMQPICKTPMVGRFEGKDLIFQGEGDCGDGQMMKFRMVTHPVSATEYTMTMSMEQGGKMVEGMKITYVKA